MTMTYQVLVVWCEVPEKVDFVVLAVDATTKEKIASFHNHYINSVDIPDEVVDQMMEFFYDKETHFKFARNQEMLSDVHFDLVVMTGFIL